MDRNKKQRHSEEERAADLHDSSADEKKLQPDTASIDLPDVSDIPGQENYKVPEEHLLGDPTVASADEEGEDVV